VARQASCSVSTQNFAPIVIETPRDRLDQDGFSSNRHPALALCLRMSPSQRPVSIVAGHALAAVFTGRLHHGHTIVIRALSGVPHNTFAGWRALPGRGRMSVDPSPDCYSAMSRDRADSSLVGSAMQRDGVLSPSVAQRRIGKHRPWREPPREIRRAVGRHATRRPSPRSCVHRGRATTACFAVNVTIPRVTDSSFFSEELLRTGHASELLSARALP
jgi:hypothetical protein